MRCCNMLRTHSSSQRLQHRTSPNSFQTKLQENDLTYAVFVVAVDISAEHSLDKKLENWAHANEPAIVAASYFDYVIRFVFNCI